MFSQRKWTADNIQLQGNNVINQEIVTNILEVKGNCIFHRKISAAQIIIDGMVDFKQNVLTNILRTSALSAINMRSKIAANTIELNGIANFLSNIKCNAFSSLKELKAKQNISSELFYSKGIINIEGQLLSNEIFIEIDLNSQTPSNIKEIAGGKIEIKGEHEVSSNTLLRCGVIRGNKIVMNHAIVDKVEGDEIYIGDDCQVDLAEYYVNIKVANNAVVNRVEKLQKRGDNIADLPTEA